MMRAQQIASITTQSKTATREHQTAAVGTCEDKCTHDSDAQVAEGCRGSGGSRGAEVEI